MHTRILDYRELKNDVLSKEKDSVKEILSKIPFIFELKNSRIIP